ncbi:MAG: hypothetical protein MHMPM18_003907, partial [Marteilia pararefringens]
AERKQEVQERSGELVAAIAEELSHMVSNGRRLGKDSDALCNFDLNATNMSKKPLINRCLDFPNGD